MVTHEPLEKEHSLLDDQHLVSFLNTHGVSLQRYNYQRFRGIYFLLRFGMVAYVGQTVDLASRIGSHYVKPPAAFDEVVFFEWEGNLTEAEDCWIAHFKPEGNRSIWRRNSAGGPRLRQKTKAAAIQQVSEAQAQMALREYLLALGFGGERSRKEADSFTRSAKRRALREAERDGTANTILWSGSTLHSVQPEVPPTMFG
jgi:hypothetical protein